MWNRTIQLLTDEEGATMIEYALMVSFIAVVCVGAVGLVGQKVAQMFGGDIVPPVAPP